MAVLVKTLNGLAYASAKTRNGLAVADISTINGLDVTSGGGFVPTDIGGCVYWFDAELLTGYIDNDPVDSADEFSGNGFTVTASGTDRPTYKSGIINGKSVLRYGTANIMSRGTVVTSNTSYTAFVTAQTSTIEVNSQFFVNGNANGFAQIINFSSSGKNGVHHPNKNIFNGSNRTTSPEILVTSGVSNVSVSMWTNGIPASLSGAFGGTTDILTPTDAFTLGIPPGNFDLASVIIYDNALSDSDREAVEDYLGTRFGITITH